MEEGKQIMSVPVHSDGVLVKILGLSLKVACSSHLINQFATVGPLSKMLHLESMYL